jgi:hypothetical protein
MSDRFGITYGPLLADFLPQFIDFLQEDCISLVERVIGGMIFIGP